MNLLCKLLGHKWRDTSSLQFKGNPRHDVWEVSRTCNRCDAFEVMRDETIDEVQVVEMKWEKREPIDCPVSTIDFYPSGDVVMHMKDGKTVLSTANRRSK